jgi:protein arginine kinase
MSQAELFIKPLTSWMDGSGIDSDIVLSSRVRLARNICQIPFPNRANIAQLSKVEENIEEIIPELAEATGKTYQSMSIDKLSTLERNVLVEKHMISSNHIMNPEHRLVIVSEDDKISIMVNEEDHLRIQCMVSGLDLGATLEMASKIDDTIEAKVDIAFTEDMGYLTSCPTNLGTGLRASVMMHLPGLVFTRQINKIMNASTQLGLAVRGLYGEGSEVIGNIFQISNQLTLGFSEQETIDNLTSAVLEIMTHERAARKALYAQSPDVVSDKVWRSYGVLKYARTITGNEALALLSEVRMGIDLNIIHNVSAKVFNELLVSSRGNYLQNLKDNGNLSPNEIDRQRAAMIREVLTNGSND